MKEAPLLNQWEQEKRDYHLRKAFRIIYKFCLRSFMGNFKCNKPYPGHSSSSASTPLRKRQNPPQLIGNLDSCS